MRKPRILTKHTVKQVQDSASTPSKVDFLEITPVVKEVSPTDLLYDTIYDQCVRGYRFSDSLYGLPWIEKEDIEDKGNGLFVIRFRCPLKYAHQIYFNAMATDVCRIEKSQLHVVHATKQETYLGSIDVFWEEFVWVIQQNEIN